MKKHNPAKVLVSIAAVAVVAAGGWAFANRTPTIDVSKYMTLSADGYNTVGKLNIDFDTDKLEQDYGKQITTRFKKQMKNLKDDTFGLSSLTASLYDGYEADLFAETCAHECEPLRQGRQLAVDEAAQPQQQEVLVVREHTATHADALQVECDDQVVQHPSHHQTQVVDDTQRGCITMTCRSQQRRRIRITPRRKSARHRIAGDLPFHVADIAAAAQGIQVVVDEHVAGMPGIAILAMQHMAIDTQTDADTGAPRDIGAVRHALQCAPAAFGNQCSDRIVGHCHPGKTRSQGRLEHGAGPVVGQAPRLAGQPAADVRRGQFDAAIADQERSARRHTHRSHIANGHISQRTTLVDQAQHLLRQGVIGALFGGGLGDPAPHALAVGHTDRHLCSADVDTYTHPLQIFEDICIGTLRFCLWIQNALPRSVMRKTRCGQTSPRASCPARSHHPRWSTPSYQRIQRNPPVTGYIE